MKRILLTFILELYNLRTNETISTLIIGLGIATPEIEKRFQFYGRFNYLKELGGLNTLYESKYRS